MSERFFFGVVGVFAGVAVDANGGGGAAREGVGFGEGEGDGLGLGMHGVAGGGGQDVAGDGFGGAFNHAEAADFKDKGEFSSEAGVVNGARKTFAFVDGAGVELDLDVNTQGLAYLTFTAIKANNAVNR